MAIEINGKVYRNLQSQVYENQKNIELAVSVVNSMEETVNQHSEDISSINGEIEDAVDDIDRLKDRMDDAELAIYDLETDVGNAQDDIDAIEANYVTTDTNQTITGEKAFNKNVQLGQTNGSVITINGADGVKTFLKIDPDFDGDSAYLNMDHVVKVNTMPDFNRGQYTVSFPQSKSGTIALTSDIQYPVTDVQLTTGTSVVSNTIATIPGVYAHHITINGGSDAKTYLYLTLLTSFQTNFDIPSFIAYINSLAQLSTNTTIACSGVVVYSVVGVTENCRAAAAIAPGSTSDNITIIYHGAGDAGIAEIQYGPTAGANFQLTTLTDAVLKVL